MLGQRRVASAGPHKVGQWADQRVPESSLLRQQGLSRRRQSDALAVELGERVPPRGHLRERLLGVAAALATLHLLFLQRRHLSARQLQGLDRLDRRLGAGGRTLGRRPQFGCDGLSRGLHLGPFGDRRGELLAQLGLLPLEGGTLAFQRPQRLGATLQVLLQSSHGRPQRHDLIPTLLLMGRPRPQLSLHSREVALGGRALGLGRSALAFGVAGALLALAAFLTGLGSTLRGVVQPLGCERQVAFESADLQPNVAKPPFHFGAPRLRRVPRLYPRFPLALLLLQHPPGGGE